MSQVEALQRKAGASPNEESPEPPDQMKRIQCATRNKSRWICRRKTRALVLAIKGLLELERKCSLEKMLQCATKRINFLVRCHLPSVPKLFQSSHTTTYGLMEAEHGVIRSHRESSSLGMIGK